jgi:hypothetical protein
MRFKSFLRRPAVTLLAIAACAVSAGAAPARAQAPGSDFAPQPAEIERMIEARGYQLMAPVSHRGRFYLADVIGRDGDPERLVIDARDGRLLHHYPGNPAMRRQAASPDEWSPLATFFGGLFGREDDVAPLSPPPASDFYETPRSKAQARRARPDLKPVTQPAAAPGDDKTASPATAASPVAAAPVATGAKTPAPQEAAVARPASPLPQSGGPKPNDVPVAPLE